VYGRLRAALEPDAGVLCRLLELFAARGVAPLAVDYALDARSGDARLRVDALMGAQDWAILCARAGQTVGLLRFEQETAVLVGERAA
jgi:hypothetical protein